MHLLPLRTLAVLGLAAGAARAHLDDLYAALVADPELSTLLSALMAVPGLAATLDDAEGITIFAPVNAAFAAVAADSLEGVAISSGDVEGIRSILSYHVVPQTIPSSAISNTPAFVQTLLTCQNYIAGGPATLTPGGQYLGAQLSGGDVVLSSGNLALSTVIQADIVVGGATIHKIDRVLVLPSNATTTASKVGLTGIAGALGASALAPLFDTAPGITAFIPTNKAFAAIADVAATLSQRQLQAVLLLHLAPGAVVFSTDIPAGASEVPSALGQPLTLDRNSTGIYVEDSAQVLAANVILYNGVAHLISSVLIPDILKAALASPSCKK